MPDFLLKVGSIVLLLGGLIFVHELGHFLVAKSLGVKVVRFSIGFGPAALRVQARRDRVPDLAPAARRVREDGGRRSGRGRSRPRTAGAASSSSRPGSASSSRSPDRPRTWCSPRSSTSPSRSPRTASPRPARSSAPSRPGSPRRSRLASARETGSSRSTPPGAPRRAGALLLRSARARVAARAASRSPSAWSARAGRSPLTIEPASEEDSNPIETTRRGVIGVTPCYVPAVVAPARPGAAGPLEPFDLVVAGGRQARAPSRASWSARSRAAACTPLDLEVVRERPLDAARRATLATFGTGGAPDVPTCAGGERTFLPGRPVVSTFIAAVVPGSPADKAGLRRGDAIAAMDGKPVRSSAT